MYTDDVFKYTRPINALLDFTDFNTTNILTNYTDDVFKYTRPINAVLDFTDF